MNADIKAIKWVHKNFYRVHCFKCQSNKGTGYKHKGTSMLEVFCQDVCGVDVWDYIEQHK